MDDRAVSRAPDDQALIGRARAGDAEAFTAIVRAYQHLVHGYALAVTADPYLAQDVAQETFLALHRQLDRLQDPRKLPAYLRMIARRSAVRLVRGREREQAVCEAWPANSTATGHDTGTPGAEDSELHQLALRALHRLSPPLREVLVLHYLKGCTHREIAGFLCIPRTSVNNRLYAGRKALAKETLKMVRQTTQDHALPEDFAQRIGRIIASRGPVVDVRFDEGLPQEEHDVFVGTERNNRLVAVQRLPEGLVRCLSVDVAGQQLPTGRIQWVTVGEESLEVGQSVTAAPAEPMPKITDLHIAGLVESLTPRAQAPTEMLPTGIKSIDLLFPLARGGRVLLMGPVGGIDPVIVFELCRRLKDEPESNVLTIYNFVQPVDLPRLQRYRSHPGAFFRGFEEGNTRQVQTFFVPRIHNSRWPDEPLASLFDSALCLDRREAEMIRYPNLDISRSRSRLLSDGSASPEHREVAAEVRRTLLEADELTADVTYWRLIANAAHREAQARWAEYLARRLAELAPGTRATVERAERLRAYLTTPFFVTQEGFGVPGKWVDLADTLRDCRSILAGDCDEMPVERLKDIGTLKEIG